MKCVLLLSVAAALALGGCATDNVAWHDANHLNSQNPPEGISTGNVITPAAETAMEERGNYDLNGPNVPVGMRALRPVVPMAETDLQFMDKERSEGVFIIDASQEALRKSADAHVQAVARQAIGDRTRLNGQLSNLAAAKGLELGKGMTGQQQGMMERLATATGPQFDQLYIGQMAYASDNAVADLQNEASYGADPDVRNWADGAVPVAQGDLVMITTPGATVRNYATER